MPKQLKEALNLVNNSKYKIKTTFKEAVRSNITLLEDNIFYFESIPKALLYLKCCDFNQKITIKNDFNTFGTMIDLSRGAVFKIEYLKEIILKEALLGVNQIWLYLEDIYALDVPYFGYLRGKYQKEELKEIINYANRLGIEIIPAIQTLGHMEQFLKWPINYEYKDQEDILLANSNKTNELIKMMLEFMKDVFNTNKIHIGLDETFGLGFGRYYKENGFKKPESIFIDHLITVNKMCLSLGFDEVMIWSDMFFRLFSKTSYYYDLNSVIDESIINQIPKNVTLVYWDYYNHDINIVNKMLEKHNSLKMKTIFASGTWVWTRFNYDKTMTDKAALMHIKSAKLNNVKEIIFTNWQDDGAYVDFNTQFLGLFDMSRSILSNDIPIEYYQYLNNESYDIALTRNKSNLFSIKLEGLVFDDPILHIYLNNFVKYDCNEIKKHIIDYEELLNELTNPKLSHTKLLVNAGLLKLTIRHLLLKGYPNNINYILIKENIKQLKKVYCNLLKSFRKMWHQRNKLYGLEIIQSRLATQITRLDELDYLLMQFKNKKINKLDFLHEEIGERQYLSLKYQGLYSSTKPR